MEGGAYRPLRVMKTEEKGSDVNLATHLLVDAFDDAFNIAVIISNDSDLKSLSGLSAAVSERKSCFWGRKPRASVAHFDHLRIIFASSVRMPWRRRSFPRKCRMPWGPSISRPGW